MKARFIGKDSLGFRNGQLYDIHTKLQIFQNKAFIVLYANNDKLHCAYTNVETLLKK